MTMQEFTATQIKLEMAQAEARFQSEVLQPFLAPLLDKMYDVMVEQGIVMINAHVPELLWWQKVLCWNPCNSFVEQPHVQFRIEPDIYL